MAEVTTKFSTKVKFWLASKAFNFYIRNKNIEELNELEQKIIAYYRYDKVGTFAEIYLLCVHGKISQLYFQNTSHYDYLSHKHKNEDIKSYLEIGVSKGTSLQLAGENCKCVAVDPSPQIRSFNGLDVELFEIKSDQFFKNNTSQYKKCFELVFLDGLHTAFQTLKDIINSADCLTDSGQILVHDVLPISPVVSTSERNTIFWTGDVWKLLPILCQDTDSYDWEVLKLGPSGLLRLYNIKNLPPEDELFDRLNKLDGRALVGIHELEVFI